MFVRPNVQGPSIRRPSVLEPLWQLTIAFRGCPWGCSSSVVTVSGCDCSLLPTALLAATEKLYWVAGNKPSTLPGGCSTDTSTGAPEVKDNIMLMHLQMYCAFNIWKVVSNFSTIFCLDCFFSLMKRSWSESYRQWKPIFELSHDAGNTMFDTMCTRCASDILNRICLFNIHIIIHWCDTDSNSNS